MYSNEVIERSIHDAMALADEGEHRRAILRLLYIAHHAELSMEYEGAQTAYELAARSLETLGKATQAGRLRRLVRVGVVGVRPQIPL